MITRTNIIINKFIFIGALLTLIAVTGLLTVTLAEPLPDDPAAVTLKINGEEVVSDVPPIIVNERTLVPARVIFESLGGEVEWFPYLIPPQVAISYGGIKVNLVIDSTLAKVNYQDATMDVPPQIINGRTLIPVRFVTEAVNFKVEWDEEGRIVDLFTPEFLAAQAPAPVLPFAAGSVATSINKLDIKANEISTVVTVSAAGIMSNYTTFSEPKRFILDVYGADFATTSGSLEWQREISVVRGVSVNTYLSQTYPDGSPVSGTSFPDTNTAYPGANGEPVISYNTAISDNGVSSISYGSSGAGAATANTVVSPMSYGSSGAAAISNARAANTSSAYQISLLGTAAVTASNTLASNDTSESDATSDFQSDINSNFGDDTSGIYNNGSNTDSYNGSNAQPSFSGNGILVTRLSFDLYSDIVPVVTFSEDKSAIRMEFAKPATLFDPWADGKLCVILDPGHGADTSGKRSPDGSLLEYEFNRDMAAKVRQQLERHGVEVLYTVYDNTDMSLADRCKTANASSADVFVSLHANAFGKGNWNISNGWEIYVYKKGSYSERLAKLIHDYNIPANGMTDRGVKAQRYYVIRNTNMPAVLIEHGFYTNKNEVELLKSAAFRDNLAALDAKGILEFLGVPWIEV